MGSTLQFPTTNEEFARFRLASQWIGSQETRSVHQVVSWMGAMQAQDFEGVMWAIGLRAGKATREEVQASYNKGEILRTHLLRPTWHMVTADDLPWLLELTAQKIKSRYKSRNHQLQLTTKIFDQSNKIIQRTLEIRGEATRDDLILELNKANIDTKENRASHLLATAELDGLICSGPLRDGKITYALLEKRISKIIHLAKEEALAELAKRYFLSRSPATLEDFAWWSGLSFKDTRIGIEANKEKFESKEIEGKEYGLANQKRVLTNYTIYTCCPHSMNLSLVTQIGPHPCPIPNKSKLCPTMRSSIPQLSWMAR